MSERRDLWYPVLALVAGLGAAAWDVASGRPLLAVLAAVLGVVACVAAIRQTLAKAKDRAAFLGIAAVFSAAALSPAAGGRPYALAASGLLFLAGAVRPTRLPEPTRRALLVVAAAFAVLGVVLALGVLPIPRATAMLALSGAFACAIFTWSSRPRPEAPPPKGPTIAVFGGSFDPFHRAHRAIAEQVLKVANRLIVVVSARPPHKAGAREPSPFHHRVALARLGVEGLPRTEVSELENRREGPSYTVDTLEALRRLYPPGTVFRLVLGADSFQEFPLWKDWEGILDRADLLVAARPGSDVEPPP